MANIPTKDEFNLSNKGERAYVWLRDLARRVDELSKESTLTLEASFSSIRAAFRGVSDRVTQLESEFEFTGNTDRAFFGTMLSSENILDFAIDELDANKYELIIFVIQSNKKVKQPYIGAEFINGSTIRINKSESVGDIDFKIVLKER